MGVAIYRVACSSRNKPTLFVINSDRNEEHRAGITLLGLTDALNQPDRTASADVAGNLEGELDTVATIASVVIDPLKKVKPIQATIEFGIELPDEDY